MDDEGAGLVSYLGKIADVGSVYATNTLEFKWHIVRYRTREREREKRKRERVK